MIQDMPRPRPMHLRREVTRHGKVAWYVRVGLGKRIRLRSEFGTPEFDAEYQAALDGRSLTRAQARVTPGTLRWLCDRYRETANWTRLSDATRRQRDNIFAGVLKISGTVKASAINKASIIAGVEKRGKTPAQARNFLDAMRGLFRWAYGAGHLKEDPTAGVSNPRRQKTTGFAPWTEDDVDRYQARWPIGTKERVWLDVLLYTGLRRGDAVRLGRQHVRSGIATLATEKSKDQLSVTIPILPILEATLKAGPCGDMAYICGEGRRPLTKESFGNAFSAAARLAGVKKSAHGVRKIGATRAAENGATVAELEALFAWRGGGMASLYTRAADRVRLAKGAINKMVRTADEQTDAAPRGAVRFWTEN